MAASQRRVAATAEYGGHGICYLEFGSGDVARVGVSFRAGEQPSGELDGPSRALAADKAAFGTERVRLVRPAVVRVTTPACGQQA